MRILYFYPENPLSLNQGNNARANALLEYFKNRSIEVDFVGVESKEFSMDRSIYKKSLFASCSYGSL